MADLNVTPDNDMTEEQCEAMLDALYANPALLTTKQVDTIEGVFREKRFGMNRRAALAIAVQDGPFFRSLKDDRQKAVLMAAVLETTTGQVNMLRELVELFETVNARLMLAIAAREDCNEVMKEGATMLADA